MDDRLPVLCGDTVLLFPLLPYPLLCANDELAKVIRGYWLPQPKHVHDTHCYTFS